MAAAYAALVSLFNDLELIHNHPRHSFSFENKQIQSLLQIVTFLIEFVESYDNAHGPSKEAAQLLERPITRAAHAAEEVIESHVVDQIRSGSTLDGKRRSRFLLDVQNVIEDMEFVRRRTIKVSKALNQPTYPAATAAAAAASSSSTPLTSDKTSMVGFKDVWHQLLDLLIGYPSSRGVIAIVGTGGIGKTTLAKYAFENTLIVGHFDVCLWATISQEYVVEDILLRLLSRDQKSNSETVGELGEQLHKKLYGRRYLVVLDDMWSVEVWDQLKFFCPDTSNGSRVVVTTRLSNVGDCIGSSSLAISFLDEDKSWDLFCVKAFGGHGCPVELEDVGKKIVKKCRGLPLAIVVVAGYLGKSSRKQEYWVSVANNMKSVLNSEENKQFLDILSFSYSHLPARLKPCFIYMGTRREDEDIDVPDLIKRWIAEGFLKPCGAKNLEDIGEDYLNDLIDRNLIFPIASLNKRYWQGEMKIPNPIPSDNLEQVMRNLQTLKRVKDLKLSDEACKRIPNIKGLYLKYSDTAVEFPISNYCLHNLACFPKLESLEFIFESYGGIGLKSEWREFGLSLKLPTSLKKLFLLRCGLDWKEITMMVGSLPHLERLNLGDYSVKLSSWTLVEETFPRLKYLRIRRCDGLVEWNAERSNFPILEYLYLGYMSSLYELPSFIGEIQTLQSIHLVECSESLMISAVRIVMESQEEYGNHDLQLHLYFYGGRASEERFRKKLREEGLTINNLHLNYFEQILL